jgi:BirA family biotin operon repressor/biotin-[acetyl-CoA-carboxylase] ligase
MAEMQTAGRGKLNRRWLSPFGRNVYLSLLWHFSGDLPQLSGLSLAVAVAIIRVLKSLGVGDALEIKWPNDLLWHKRKLAGVLIDLYGEFNGQCYAVIGVGLNVSLNAALKKSVNFPIADLSEIITPPSRNHLHAMLIAELLDVLALFQKKGLSPFIAEFQAVNFLLDKAVEINLGFETFNGIARGIDADGYFLLENATGDIRDFLVEKLRYRVHKNIKLLFFGLTQLSDIVLIATDDF